MTIKAEDNPFEFFETIQVLRIDEKTARNIAKKFAIDIEKDRDLFNLVIESYRHIKKYNLEYDLSLQIGKNDDLNIASFVLKTGSDLTYIKKTLTEMAK